MRLVNALAVPLGLAAACLAGCGDEPRPAAPAAAVADPIGDRAREHRRERLAREIARLEAELGVIPEGLDATMAARERAVDEAGYETWLITQERQELRHRIERLRARIVLLEQVGRDQDLRDRAVLTEAKNEGVAIHSDRAVSREAEAEARSDREQARWLIAHRDAKRAQLERIRAELDLMDAPPALPEPARPAVEMPDTAGATPAPAPAPTAEVAPEPIDPMRSPAAEAPSAEAPAVEAPPQPEAPPQE